MIKRLKNRITVPRPRRQKVTRPQAWRSIMRRRLFIGGAIFAVWVIAIEARLSYLQISQHDKLVLRAERQQNRSVKTDPKRGEIVDRKGRVLAYSVDADTVYAIPTAIDDPTDVATALCRVLNDCDETQKSTLKRRLGQEKAFTYIQRRVTPEEARRVASLNLEGVGFLKENRRYYPNKDLAAHLLGFVGTDNQGLSGIEFRYEKEISGRPGKVLIQTDAKRRAFGRVEQPPTAGADVELTIDKYLQHIAERELASAVQLHKASGGTVVILDPYSGDIFAIANLPTFNPNAFAQSSSVDRRNRAVQDVYEPGSTFKLVTAAAAFEEGLTNRNELFDVSAGEIRVGNSITKDMHTYGVISFEDVIVLSSNVGAIKVGLRLGPERFSRYIRRFGFGESISRDLSGESPGIVHNPAKITELDLKSMSMGYGVSVTPLQMASAASAVANGGQLIEPRIVRSIISNGIRTPERKRRVIRRAITSETAAELTEIMEAVVERGTAKQAKVFGYTVAGKTGTAEKLVNGRYSGSQHYASFVGFVPSRQPELTILVVIDDPQKPLYTGGAVAAPVFRRIAEAALRHLAIPPTIDSPSPLLVSAKTPKNISLRPTDAYRIANAPSVNNKSFQNGLMPDLRGLSARKVIEVLTEVGLTARLNGNGFVFKQDPSPGTRVKRGEVAVINLMRFQLEKSGDAQ